MFSKVFIKTIVYLNALQLNIDKEHKNIDT